MDEIPKDEDEMDYYIKLKIEIGHADTVAVRFWDNAFNKWCNGGCELDKPDYPLPYDHPIPGHCWNWGLEPRKAYLRICFSSFWACFGHVLDTVFRML